MNTNRRRLPKRRVNRRARRSRIPRQIANIHPRELVVRLTFYKHLVLNAPSLNQVEVRFRPTNAFDVDPVIASTAMSGFNECAAIYEYYRVLHSSTRVTFTNLEANLPSSVGCCPTNVDLGTSALATALYSNPNAKKTMVGPLNGTSTKTLFHRMSTQQISGFRDARINDNFTALTTGGPVDNWYWYYFCSLPTGTYTSGVEAQINITVTVRFFSVIPPVS